MTLRIPAKVLIHVWSYDFYDMTLSTGKQRRHMINTCNFRVCNFELLQIHLRHRNGAFSLAVVIWMRLIRKMFDPDYIGITLGKVFI